MCSALTNACPKSLDPCASLRPPIPSRLPLALTAWACARARNVPGRSRTCLGSVPVAPTRCGAESLAAAHPPPALNHAPHTRRIAMTMWTSAAAGAQSQPSSCVRAHVHVACPSTLRVPSSHGAPQRPFPDESQERARGLEPPVQGRLQLCQRRCGNGAPTRINRAAAACVCRTATRGLAPSWRQSDSATLASCACS